MRRVQLGVVVPAAVAAGPLDDGDVLRDPSYGDLAIISPNFNFNEKPRIQQTNHNKCQRGEIQCCF